jgi:Asp/Glu/hydantoin racemase
MAEMAVTSGDRIAIVAALESTIAPTHELVAETATRRRRTVTIVDAPCLEAWSHWEAGDPGRYFATLASHLQSLDGTCDVIVLAQASMAPVEKIIDLETLVVSSPRTAVRELVGLS